MANLHHFSAFSTADFSFSNSNFMSPSNLNNISSNSTVEFDVFKYHSTWSSGLYNFSKFTSFPLNVSTNTTTSSANQIAEFHAGHQSLLTAYLAVGLCICLIGVYSNIVCLSAIFLCPKLRHVGNILVGNFVLVNLALSGLAYPMSIITVYLHRYPSLHFPDSFCRWIYLYYFCIHSLCWQECMLAVNRFVAIVIPFQYQYVSSTRALLITAALGYAVPFILNICAATSSEIPLFMPEEPFGGCLYNPRSPMGFRVLHGTVGVYLPMAMVGAAYVAVFVKVVLNTCVNGVELRGSYRRRVVISKMLFTGFGWFCLTYLPQPVLTTYFKKTYDDNPESYVCSRWALFLGAGANAIVYALVNKDYRRGMTFVLQRGCHKVGATRSRPDMELEFKTGILGEKVNQSFSPGLKPPCSEVT